MPQTCYPVVYLHPRPPSNCTMLDTLHHKRFVRSARKLGKLLGTTPTMNNVLLPIHARTPGPPATHLSPRTPTVLTSPPRRRASPRTGSGSPTLRRRRIEKLKRQLGENVPPALLFAAAGAPRSAPAWVVSPLLPSEASCNSDMMDVEKSIVEISSPQGPDPIFNSATAGPYMSSPQPRRGVERTIGSEDTSLRTAADPSLDATLFPSPEEAAPKLAPYQPIEDDSFLDLDAALDFLSSADSSFADLTPDNIKISDARELRRLAVRQLPPLLSVAGTDRKIATTREVHRLTVHMPLPPLSAELGPIVEARWPSAEVRLPVETRWPAPELSAFKFTFPEPTMRCGLDLSRGVHGDF